MIEERKINWFVVLRRFWVLDKESVMKRPHRELVVDKNASFESLIKIAEGMHELAFEEKLINYKESIYTDDIGERDYYALAAIDKTWEIYGGKTHEELDKILKKEEWRTQENEEALQVALVKLPCDELAMNLDEALGLTPPGFNISAAVMDGID